MSSVFNCRCRRALWTSTIGLSPVTVTVSSSVPTRISALTVDTKSAGQFQSVANEGIEAGQLETDLVGAGAQVEDPILARPVSDGRADLLDERVAGRFHGHSGQYRAGRVVDDSSDRRLSRRSDGNEQYQGDVKLPSSAGSAWLSLSANVAPRR